MWNTLSVPLENGWQCTLIPGTQYYDLMAWGRGYRNMLARQLYPNAGRDNSTWSWNGSSLSDVDKSESWEQDRLRQLADDRAAFARHFRPNWDLRSITGAKALRDVQAFVRDSLNLAHWDLPPDNAAVKKLLTDAVASSQLVPVVNREYRGVPQVAQPTPGPLRRPASGGGGGTAYLPKIYSYSEFQALQRANGELPPLDAPAGRVGATLDPLPDLGAPATADDGIGLLGFVASAPSGLLGGGEDESNSGGDTGEEDSLDDGGGEDSSDGSTPLGDAPPFEYSDDSAGSDVTDLAAHGVSEEDEADCFSQYERDLDLCEALGGPMGGERGKALCKQSAFQNYQQCRGY